MDSRLGMQRSYEDLIKINTFEGRFEYLRLFQNTHDETFGMFRYLNQRFYKSREWLSTRQQVILRDIGCDLAFPGHDIFERIIVHHINPITLDDFNNHNEAKLLGMNNLITIAFATHNVLTYGGKPYFLPERSKGDHCPWTIQSLPQ